MRRLAIFALLFCFVPQAQSGEVGFEEEFALSQNRAEALKKLVPGTDDYYYYHCLHAQNEKRLADAEKLIPLWIQRSGGSETPRIREIRLRSILLGYDADPAKAYAALREWMGLAYGHQREIMGEEPGFPTALNPASIAWEALKARALANHSDLGGFTNRALERLAGEGLDGQRRRHLLQRMERPDVSNLVDLVLADLDFEYSGGFGTIPIHAKMLQSQLDELLKRRPALKDDANFVTTYLVRLQPGPDEDWRHDEAARERTLDRLWAFVSPLAPAFNSLKAHILYQRLAHDRAKGVYDKERFLAYLTLPRQMGYMEPKYLQQRQHREHPVDLSAQYGASSPFPPVGNDEPLVRDFLAHFFLAEDDYKPYARLVRSDYLKPLFA